MYVYRTITQQEINSGGFEPRKYYVLSSDSKEMVDVPVVCKIAANDPNIKYIYHDVGIGLYNSYSTRGLNVAGKGKTFMGLSSVDDLNEMGRSSDDVIRKSRARTGLIFAKNETGRRVHKSGDEGIRRSG